MDIGIDLGTASVLIYVQGHGIVLDEPSLAAVRKNGQPLAFGSEALPMLGRTPEDITVLRPLKDGVIADGKTAEAMLRYFLRKIIRLRPFERVRAVLCVPCGVTEVERLSVQQIAQETGIAQMRVVEEPLAAGLGAGLDIFSPQAHMIADIGGGTSDLALLSRGGVVASTTLRTAGDEMNEAVAVYVKKTYRLALGQRTAEEVKMQIASAIPRTPPRRMTVIGQDIASGLPRAQSLGSEELLAPLDKPIRELLEGIGFLLDRTPPELSRDLQQTGITLAGGGALLAGLADRIARQTGLPCQAAEDPLKCVARGAGMLAEMKATFTHGTLKKDE